LPYLFGDSQPIAIAIKVTGSRIETKNGKRILALMAR